MELKSSISYLRVAPRKVRVVADAIRGLNVNKAIEVLEFAHKRSAPILTKMLRSAVANADQKKTIDVDNLYVKHISVDQGPTLKRFMPRAMGRASEIRKKTSHVNLVLAER